MKRTDVPYTGGDAAGAAAPEIAGDPTLQMGQATFAKICAACHQPTARGIPGQFPPLAKSDYLAAAPKEQIIGHVLHGLQGPITVLGTTYSGQMPPLAFLSDDDIAAVLTYVRTSFGNDLSKVTSDEVKQIRTRTAGLP
jgi:nitrite reductase (NO-forming)